MDRQYEQDESNQRNGAEAGEDSEGKRFWFVYLGCVCMCVCV